MRDRGLSLLMAIFGCLLAATVSVTAYRVCSFYTVLPVWDYWDVVEHLPAYRAVDVRVLWQQHNEHRIPVPEAVFALDLSFAHGLMLLPIAISCSAYLLTCWLLASSFLRDFRLSSKRRWLAVLLAGTLGLFETVSLSLAVPFLLQWTLLELGVVASLHQLLLIGGSPSWKPLCLTVVAGSLATYSSGNGMLIWPILLGLALALGFSRRVKWSIGFAAVSNIGTYLIGYRFSASRGHHQLAAVGKLPGFVLSFLSAPFGLMKAPWFGVTVGTANLVLVAVCCLVLWRRKRLLVGVAPLLLGVYLFTVMSALVAAGSRMSLADPSFLAAKQSRYLVMTQIASAVVVLLVLYVAGNTKAYLPVFAVLAVLLMAGILKLDRWTKVTAEGSILKQQQAAAEIREGHYNRDLITHYVFPDFDRVMAGLQALKQQNLSVYYQPSERRTP